MNNTLQTITIALLSTALGMIITMIVANTEKQELYDELQYQAEWTQYYKETADFLVEIAAQQNCGKYSEPIIFEDYSWTCRMI